MNQPYAGPGMPGRPTGPVMAGATFCPKCGAQLVGRVQRCHRCGAVLGAAAAAGAGRSKLAAALLAFFLGGFGAHKFYLGKTGWGFVYLLFCCTGIPGLVAFVEFILLLVMSEEDFQAKYPGSAPNAALIVIIAAVPVMVAIVGILAAIAIPNFLRYQLRSKASATPHELGALMNAEVKRANSGKGILSFHPVPAEPPGTQKRAPSSEEQQVLADLGWELEPTYAQFRVAVRTQGNLVASSYCAETDLDGDGKNAAVIGFLPVMDGKGGVAIAPPPAPCSEAAVIGPDGLGFRPEWSNKWVAISPPDTF